MLARFPVRLSLLALLAGLVLLLATEADAHRGRPPRIGPMQSYSALKIGGYGLDSISSDDDHLNGLFVGLEWGASPSPFVEVGFTADWFHRSEGRTEYIQFDTPYVPPVQGVAELDGTSTDLFPLGGLVRLRMPLADGRFAPYVSGQLTWDLLRLEYHEAVPGADGVVVYEESDYFHGLGSTFALGVETNLDSAVGLLLEAGVHQSEPEKDFVIDGIPVTGKVDADGDFLRIGMRFAFR
jgi:hypothetical protein